MSTLEEHDREQAELTRQYETLSKIGRLAVDHGADIDMAGSEDWAMEFCAERQEQMSVAELRIFDEARIDQCM